MKARQEKYWSWRRHTVDEVTEFSNRQVIGEFGKAILSNSQEKEHSVSKERRKGTREYWVER